MSLVEPRGQLEAIGVASRSPRAFVRGPLRPVALASARTRISAAAAKRTIKSLDVCIVAACFFTPGVLGGASLLAARFADVAPVLAAVWITLFLLDISGAQTSGPRESILNHLAKVSASVLAACLIALLVGMILGSNRRVIWAWSLLDAAALVLAHTGWWLNLRRWRSQGRMTPNIVVVGATENARKLIRSALESREVAVLGVFDDRLSRSPEAISGVPVLGDTDALMAHPLLPYVDRIVITVAPWAQTRIRGLIERLGVLPNPVTLFMDLDSDDARTATVARLAAGGLGRSVGMEDDERRAFAKRVQDLVIGGLGLVIAAPVMIVAAFAVKLESPGPVFFRQRRYGFNNEAITVWKFRSMRVEAADATAARQVCKDDDRVTRVGRWIRKLSIDELPQLFNVMTGEMSLVGPRPHAIGMKTGGEDSSRLVAEYAWRHRMKPGLTGWAQINGSIGAVDTAEAVKRRVALDVEYIETQSFWRDIYILVMTLPALIRARNMVR